MRLLTVAHMTCADLRRSPMGLGHALADALRAFVADSPRCALCGEQSGGAGTSLHGLVHKWGPRGHAFVAEGRE
jgi:hypothetical protein